MSKFASFLSGNAVVVGGAAAAAVVAVVVVVASGVFKTSQPVPSKAVTEAVTEAETTTEITTEPTTNTVSDAAPDAASATTTDMANVILPTFDVVRVEPDGRTLIAGSGAPRVEIAILVDQVEIAATTTDDAGKFVSFLDIAPSDQAQTISLVQKGTDGTDGTVDVASEVTVILTPTILTPTPQVAELSEPASEPVSEPTGSAATEQTDTEIATETTTQTASTPVAPTVILKDGDQVTILQSPSQAGPDVMSNVALDSITYSPAGEVQLSGRSAQQGFVRVYLDNSPITTSPINKDGNWRMDLPDVDTGVYTLRVDAVDAQGNVVSRVETPFKREDQTTLQAASHAADQAGTAATVITVQPGSTLWAIANDHYGDGVQYVRVYDANRDRIRDPNLIYPGQVFSLPEN